jgi:hypothetical protein
MSESASASPKQDPEAELGRTGVAESVSVEQVKLLYANLRVSQAVALVNGVVLAIVQSIVIEARQVVIWLACLFLVTLARDVLGLRFARSAASVENILRWRAYFLVGAVSCIRLIPWFTRCSLRLFWVAW